MKLIRKIQALFRKEKLDTEMAEEMRMHLEMQAAANVRAGTSVDDAHHAARRQFGHVDSIAEHCRDQRGFLWFDQFCQDVRYGTRALCKSPGFTTIAVLSLALGIGANTAIFSLVDDVLLRSLPVQKPEELVLFRWLAGGDRGLFNGLSGRTTTDLATGMRTSTSLSYFTFERLRDRTDAFSEVFAFGDRGSLNIIVNNQAELARGQCVTGGYFRGLSVAALRGRMLTDSDDRPEASPVAVISFGFWERRFGGNDAVIGKTILVNNVVVTIVGVTPRGFNGTLQIGEVSDISLPIAIDPQLRDRFDFFRKPLAARVNVMARLRPGVTAEQARAQAEPIFVQAACDAWLAGAPGTPGQSLEGRDIPRLRLEAGGQGLMDTRRDYAQPLRMLSVIVALVLAIASANVANLLLARAATRHKEIAIRLSIGASRWRVVRQLLTESLLLSLLGGSLGILFAFCGRDSLVRLRSYGSSGSLDLNFPVLAFTLGVSILTGLLFGLAPAWRATSVDLNSALKVIGSDTVGRSRFAPRHILMVAQVALSVVLLVGAGLFLRTLHNLRAVDTGFEREHLITFGVNPWLNGYRQTQVNELLDRLLNRLNQLPGVRSAALSAFPLLSGARRDADINAEPPRLSANQAPSAFGVNIVSPGYFATLQIPVLLGRDLNDHDTATSPHVALVNETFAQRLFPGENPLGRRFSFTANHIRSTEIVGVVRDGRYADLRNAIAPTVYLPFAQDDGNGSVFIVRAIGNPSALATAIRATVHDTDRTVPLQGLRTQEEQIDQLVSQERLFAQLSAFFGLVALLLTCIGLYGLLAHQVTTRTREIGIRMALGAQMQAVLALILGEGLRLTALGVAIGLAAALALTGFVSKMLFQVTPTDPLSLAAAGLLLIAVAAFACYLPARRATRVDPLVALRCE